MIVRFVIRIAALLIFPLDCIAALLVNPGLCWTARMKQRSVAKPLSRAAIQAQFVLGALLLIVALPGFALARPCRLLNRYTARRIAEKSRGSNQDGAQQPFYALAMSQ